MAFTNAHTEFAWALTAFAHGDAIALIGSMRDCYENTLAETAIGLHKAG